MGNPQWHALQVRPRFERIVALRLHQRAVEPYLPLRRMSRQRVNTHPIELPLFPGYVFCKCDRARVSSLWDIPGVLVRVREADGIDVVSEQQITDLRRILAAGLRVQPCPFIQQGKIVMVEDGPLSGVTGILEERAGKRLLALSIPLIRRSIFIKIDDVHPISFRSGAAFPFGTGYRQANLSLAGIMECQRR